MTEFQKTGKRRNGRRAGIGGLARDRSGSTAIEFALLGSALMMLTLGILEYGRLSWTREALQSIAILGARCMGVQAASCDSGTSYSATATTGYLTQQAQAYGITLPGGAFSLSRTASCAGVAGFSKVTISYTFQTVVPLLFTSMSTGVPLAVGACFPNQS